MDHGDRHDNPYTGYYGTRPQKHQRGCSVPMFFLAMLSLCILGIFYVRWLENRAAESSVTPDAISDLQTVSTAPAANDSDSLLILEPEVDALTLQEIYKKTLPSVVSILTADGSGTGVILSADGYIITNQHLVADSDTLTVILQDKDEYEAALIGSDAVSDLAILKIDAVDLTAAEFGDSSAVQVGDPVVAIGNPLGPELGGTMANGIIAAINQDFTTAGRTLTLFQTNAQVGGGPLLNDCGQIIAIATPQFAGYDAEGNIAIPTATVKGIVDALIEKGYVAGQAAIGIWGETVPGHVQNYYHLPAGVYVSEVAADSDAAAHGIQEGDVITAVNGTAVASKEELNAVKNQFSAGEQITLTVWRSDETLEITVTLIDRSEVD